MHRPLLLVLTLLLATPASADRVVEVTLFPDRAAVTREAHVTVIAGDGTFTFDGLPAGVDRNSLRVSAHGLDGLTLGAVESRLVQTTGAAQVRLRTLQSTLQDVEDRRREHTDQERALQIQLTFIERLAGPAQAGERGVAPAAEPGRWQEAWQMVGRGAIETLEAIRSSEQSRRELDAEADRLRREIEALGRERRQQLELHIHYTARSGGNAVVTLDYQLHGAGWTPRYEARLDTTSGELALIQRAEAYQSSGEAWEEVTLWLSTSRPALGGRLPDLPPWYIDVSPPQPQVRAARGQIAEADMLAAAPARAEEALAELETTDFSARYRVPGRVTLPGDNSRQRFTLDERSSPASLTSRVVPKRSTDAYLYASSEYAGEIALPSGPLALFQDGAYAGDGRLDTLAPGAPLQLAFGVDDKIRIDYVLERESRGQQGFLRRSDRLERRYRIAIDNHHTRPMTVTVLDQLPVPRDERITVELDRDASAPDQRDIDGRQGVLLWNREIAAGGSDSIRFGYTVSWPEGIEGIWGL